jgi:hypothetical protein
MINEIQSRASASNAVDQSLAFLADVQAGSLIVAQFRESSTEVDPVVTFTIGATPHSPAKLIEVANRSMTYWLIAPAGGACTIAINSAGTTGMRMTIHEFSGNWPADPTEEINSASAFNTSPITGPAVVTTGPRLIITTWGSASDITALAAGSGWNLEAAGLGNRCALAWRIEAAGGTFGPTWSWTGTSNGGEGATAAFAEVPGPAITLQPTDQAMVEGPAAPEFKTVEVPIAYTLSGDLVGVRAEWFNDPAWEEIDDPAFSVINADDEGAVLLIENPDRATWDGRSLRLVPEDENAETPSDPFTLAVYAGASYDGDLATDPAGDAAGTVESDVPCDVLAADFGIPGAYIELPLIAGSITLRGGATSIEPT